ncbi:hypothetical protein PRUPE_5G004200 [Prunus persica]|uniref:Uncharacterized protein n=1 Tax=Prunus persica TaxID=3760 RepID=A0A251P1C7_PRUPE|nr:hypothetical protein PRUPE_5G004200 [Prunus persica]
MGNMVPCGPSSRLSWPKLRRSRASEEWRGFERQPGRGGWESLRHEAMAMLHVDDDKVAAISARFGEKERRWLWRWRCGQKRWLI